MMKARVKQKDKRCVRLGLGLLAFLSLSAPLFAQTEQDDIREQCRTAVSGALLNAHNDVDRQRESLTAAKEQLRKLKSHKLALQADLDSLRKKSASTPYNRELEEALIAAEHQFKRVQAEIAQNEQLQGEYGAGLKRAEERLKQMTALLLQLFEKIYPEDLRRSKGYRFTLAYKESCSRYSYLCPLSTTGRKQLSEISKFLGGIIACDRYAQLQIKPR